jgi:uncharacterized protein (DUF433 family)
MSRNLALIDRRCSAAGEQAYVGGSSTAVWEVIMLLQSYDGDADAVAKHLAWSRPKVDAAIDYAKDFPDEIESALKENDAMDIDALRALLPNITEFRVPLEDGR